MALPAGTHLGPYEVTAQIGVGGMGEVYRATDTKLKRDVAIKVLPDSLAADPERLARFQREAEVLASLNHPNIAHIHGLEDSGGTKALVMELVEGPTLADRIARGPIPVDEALPLAKQMAEALEAAHEQGIVHRDLKPANIKVQRDGMVKVLDFGLAKALEPASPQGASAGHAPSILPTITTPAMTAAGTILGRAAAPGCQSTAACRSPAMPGASSCSCRLPARRSTPRCASSATASPPSGPRVRTSRDESEGLPAPGSFMRWLRVPVGKVTPPIVVYQHTVGH
jgi:serine/threonine protein kinase